MVVAQHRDRTNVLSGIKMAALEEGLKKIFLAAKKKKGKPSLCAELERNFRPDMCCDFGREEARNVKTPLDVLGKIKPGVAPTSFCSYIALPFVGCVCLLCIVVMVTKQSFTSSPVCPSLVCLSACGIP